MTEPTCIHGVYTKLPCGACEAEAKGFPPRDRRTQRTAKDPQGLAIAALAAALHNHALFLHGECDHLLWNIHKDNRPGYERSCDLDARAILDALRADPAASRSVAAALLTPEMLARAVHRTHNVLEAEPEPCGEDTAGVWSDRGYAAAILAALRGEP